MISYGFVYVRPLKFCGGLMPAHNTAGYQSYLFLGRRGNIRADGEIGRRDSLRSYWGNPWRFKSSSAQIVNRFVVDYSQLLVIDAELCVFDSEGRSDRS